MGKGRVVGIIASIVTAVTAIALFVWQINLIFEFFEWIIGLF